MPKAVKIVIIAFSLNFKLELTISDENHSEIDVHGGAGMEQWVAESKWQRGRKVGPGDIQKLLDKAEVVKKDRQAERMRIWFFSYEGFSEEALELMPKQGLLWSTKDDLDGLLDYVKLRRLPKL